AAPLKRMSNRPHHVQILGPGFGVGNAEASAMLQRGHGFPRAVHQRWIDPGNEPAGLCAAVGQYLAPGSYNERMTVGLALVLVQPALGRSENEAAVFDGAGAQ